MKVVEEMIEGITTIEETGTIEEINMINTIEIGKGDLQIQEIEEMIKNIVVVINKIENIKRIDIWIAEKKKKVK